MSKIALTIDGGGTSTKASIGHLSDFDGMRLPSRSITTHQINSPLNVTTVGLDEIPAALRKIAAECGIRFKDIGFIFCGLAGIDHPAVAARVAEHVRSMDIPRDTPVIVQNDIYIGLRAEYHKGGSSGVIISGTGSNCAIEAANGKLSQRGGTGWLLGDEKRSGSWLGRRALTWAIEELQRITDSRFNDLRCKDVATVGLRSGSTLLTLLTGHITKLYHEELETNKSNYRPNPKFSEWCSERIYVDENLAGVRDAVRVRFAAQFARPALVAAQRRDPVALRWADELSINIAELLIGTIRMAPAAPDRIALVGGIIASKGPVNRGFREHLQRSLVKPPKLSPYPSGERLVERALVGALRHHADTTERGEDTKSTSEP